MDFNIKDVFLEVLNLSDTYGYADAVGIQRFVLKYLNQNLNIFKIDKELIIRRIRNIDSTDSKINFESFYKLFLDHQKSLLI